MYKKEAEGWFVRHRLGWNLCAYPSYSSILAPIGISH